MTGILQYLLHIQTAGVPIHSRRSRRELLTIFSAWFALAALVLSLAWQNKAIPGLYYDEAIFAGLAKNFLTGNARGQELSLHLSVPILGHPFPVYAQDYMGAVKSWLFVPSFALFGATLAVVRLTSLFWSLAGLLIFTLWTTRLLGLGWGIVAGALLALDPTFFFLGILDWGGFVPSFLCRVAAFSFAVLWWQTSRGLYAFLAGLSVGLGFFNKIDFAVIVAGVGLAGICIYGRQLWTRIRACPGALALGGLGAIVGTGPMLIRIPAMIGYALSGGSVPEPGEADEKFNTLLAMYDGSYFHRLMETGGMFGNMYEHSARVWGVLGPATALAAVFLLLRWLHNHRGGHTRELAGFLLLSTVLVSFGVLLLPGAVKIHHMVLVYPFPHLLISLALASLWTTPGPAWKRVRRSVVSLTSIALLVSGVVVVEKTQHFIRRTGGRGMFSNAFDTFCRDMKDRKDLTIYSLDWGFNEQLIFLTDGPRLAEPFWPFTPRLTADLPRTNSIYLLHPPEYTYLSDGSEYLKEPGDTNTFEVKPYCDREGRVAFYAVQFRAQ